MCSKTSPSMRFPLPELRSLKEGKLVKSVISPTNTQPLLMLLGKLKSGVIDIADKDAESEKRKPKKASRLSP